MDQATKKAWQLFAQERYGRFDWEGEWLEVKLANTMVTASTYTEGRLGYGSITYTRITAKIPVRDGFFIRIKAANEQFTAELSDPSNALYQSLIDTIKKKLGSFQVYQCSIENGAVSFWREEVESSPLLLQQVLQLAAETANILKTHYPEQFEAQKKIWKELGDSLQASAFSSQGPVPTLEFLYQGHDFRLVVISGEELQTTRLSTHGEIANFTIRPSSDGTYQAETSDLAKFLQCATPNLMRQISLLGPSLICAKQQNIDLWMNRFEASLEKIQLALEIVSAFLSRTENPYR
jgi:hypothetical protein